ncbi:MAG TPA: hypothetical protein VN688_01725 [Gemmataceae bacterium]|nr:hypothetical protein [Gemmataceae bacterium]
MKCFLSAVLGSMFVVGLSASARAADDKDAQAILNKAIKALGGQFIVEATYADYKEFGGIKIATTIVRKRDGEKTSESHITEFRVLDKVDPKTFDEDEG